jgi:hypothetical protein
MTLYLILLIEVKFRAWQAPSYSGEFFLVNSACARNPLLQVLIALGNFDSKILIPLCENI